MANEDNKVHYDLDDVYVAKLTIKDGAVSYGDPRRLFGAIGIDLSAEGDTTKLRADGMDYYVSVANNGYTGDLSLAMVPDWLKAEYLGHMITEQDKVLVEDTAIEPNPFALLFRFKGDKHGRRHVMYNCVAARPNVKGENKDNPNDPDTEALPLTCSPLPDGKVKASTTAETPASVYDNWNKAVWLQDSPAAAQSEGS